MPRAKRDCGANNTSAAQAVATSDMKFLRHGSPVPPPYFLVRVLGVFRSFETINLS